MGVAALGGHLYLHFKCWHCPENRGFIQSRARIILGMALASIGMFCKVLPLLFLASRIVSL